MNVIFSHQSGSNITECRHVRFSFVISFNKFALGNFSYYFVLFLWWGFDPLHCIDSESCPEWFGQNNLVTWLGVIRHKELIVLYDSNGRSSHHWPHVVNSLTSSNLSLSLFSSISESLYHESCCNILLLFVHLSWNSQNHKDFFDICDSHCIQIRNSVTKSDSTEHVRRLNQGIKEIESRH